MAESRTGISKLPGTIIGYRKNGRPIRVIAGGSEPLDPELIPPAGDNVTMSKAALDKLLSDARNRAYTKADKAAADAATMTAELADLRRAEKARADVEAQAAQAAVDAQRRADEAELSAKELIDRRSRELQVQYEKQQNEWVAQVSGLQQQMADQQAVFAKEREFQELANYTTSVVNAAEGDIAPELVENIGGNTREEIDASIERAKRQTAAILSGIQQAQTAARAAMPGVSTGGFTPTSPLDSPSGTQQFTPEQIKAMPMKQYSAHRAQFGVTGSGKGEGLFG